MAEETLPACKLCGQQPAVDWENASCDGIKVFDRQVHPKITVEFDQWRLLMSDTAALRKGARVGVEAAAKVIRQHTIAEGHNGPYLMQRRHGTIDGLAYAEAILRIDTDKLVKP